MIQLDWEVKYQVENSYSSLSGKKVITAKHEKDARKQFERKLSFESVDGKVTIMSIKRKVI